MDQSASLLRKEPPTVTRTGSFALTWNLLSARALAVNEDERCSLALAAADSNGRGPVRVRVPGHYQNHQSSKSVHDTPPVIKTGLGSRVAGSRNNISPAFAFHSAI